MLYSRKFHPLLLGNSDMLHEPKNHTVYQSDFHNCNQSKVYWLFGCTVGKVGPHIFLVLKILQLSLV